MQEYQQKLLSTAYPLISLISASLKQVDRSGLSAILKNIAETFESYGCVFWEVAPGSDLEKNPQDTQ
jgi:hypothetical protein